MDYQGYCVRVDALDGYAERIRMLPAVTDYEAIIGAEHQGSTKKNPHYHLVVKTKVKDQAFRVRMKKVFDKGKGNAHMGIKPWDGSIKAISYLFHEDENAPLVVRHNVTDETISAARALNQQVQREVAQAKERASWKLEDEVFKMFEGQSPDADTIAKRIILVALRSGRYMPNDYLLRAMVTKISFRLLNGDVDAEEAFAERLVHSIFHRFD